METPIRFSRKTRLRSFKFMVREEEEFHYKPLQYIYNTILINSVQKKKEKFTKKDLVLIFFFYFKKRAGFTCEFDDGKRGMLVYKKKHSLM